MDNMGNVKFCLDEALEGSWLKYVRTAPSHEESNLAICHISEDQVSSVIPLLPQAVALIVPAEVLECLSSREL